MPDLATLFVLVTDDEEAVRRVLVKALNGLGIGRVQTAGDVKTAVRIAQACPAGAALAICDLNVLGGGTPALLGALASVPHPPAIVLMSGAGKLALQEAARLAQELRLAVVGQLEKPFTGADVAAVLNAFVGNHEVAKIRPARDKAVAQSGMSRTRVRDFAHEASAPLMAITMLSELLLDDESLPQPQREEVRLIHRAGTELTLMLERLRDEARET
jgi:DNA-binding NtrC family response regulator